MSTLRNFLAVFVLMGSIAQSASAAGDFGLNIGIGFPFLTQAGLNYRISEKLGVSAGYNLLDLKNGEASLKLSMPEVLVNFHPFSGSFFVGAGVGKESLEVTATESLGSDTVSIEVTANTFIVKTGWMWGASNGGFWFGLDFSYIKPSSPDSTITAPGVPVADQSYIDAVDAADKFGETAFVNVTFARFGWLF